MPSIHSNDPTASWQNACHPYVPGLQPSYGYVPSLGAGITFCILFGLSMGVHLFQCAQTRTWWCSVFAVGCLGMYDLKRFLRGAAVRLICCTVEIIGWAGRTWSAKCPYNNNAFLMQISTLIIGMKYIPWLSLRTRGWEMAFD
jgi:RTA1 like protein